MNINIPSLCVASASAIGFNQLLMKVILDCVFAEQTFVCIKKKKKKKKMHCTELI